jgi:hypothetical protein
MKRTKLNDLSIDWKATARMRSKMAKAKKFTITINVDRSALAFLGKLSARDRNAYQTLLAGALKRYSITPSETERRLLTVEQELRRLKRRLAA